MTMSPHIDELRQHLMNTLADLRDREKPMEPDRARAVAQVAAVLVDTAKVEIDYLKVTGQEQSRFLEIPADEHVKQLGHTPDSGFNGGKIERAPGVTRHRLV